MRSYRAAYFSITRQSFWALEVLADARDFTYDSSIFPVRNWRYGIPDFSRRPLRIETACGPICELPISTRRRLWAGTFRLGGRLLPHHPYAVTRSNLRAVERAGMPAIFYLHPWELDADHPRVPFHWKPRVTHYFNLRSTLPRLERLLAEFRFAPLAEVLPDAVA